MFNGSSQANEDPLVKAYEDIRQLNIDINNLVYKDTTQELINIAQQEYSDAISAKDNKDNAIIQYNNAISEESTAISELSLAQSAVDGQTVTVSTALIDKDNALIDKNTSQEQLDIANINLQIAQSNIQSAGGSGLQYTVYNLARVWPSIAVPDSVICSGTWNSNSMQLPVCGNRYENIVVKFTGQITVPSHWTSTYFAGYTDDGFKMYIDGQLAISNWREQGSTWSPYSPTYDVTTDKTFDVEIWWYNGGGPGNYHLGWAIPGGWTGAGCDYTGGWGVGFSCNLGTFSSGTGPTQEQTNAYNQAVLDQQAAQSDYNTKLSIYNNKLYYYNEQTQNLTNLTQNLTIAQQNLTISQSNLTYSLNNKINAENQYDESIFILQNAIIDAREEYEEQWEFEEGQRVAASIANALANQPTPIASPDPEPTVKPSPEPSTTLEPSPEPNTTPEPSSEPSPEPTKPVDPTPEPTPETTDEPKPEPTVDPEPTLEPSPEPSPQPTDINPTPTPEPEPTPTEPSEEPSPNNGNINELIPEKGQGTSEDLSRVIANLTSKDNVVVKLNQEQMAAVSQTLLALSTAAKVEVASSFGVKVDDVAILAETAKDNPAVAAAIVSFEEKAAENAEAPMPYTIADAITEAAAELFLEDPLAVFSDVDFEALSSPSEWGKDMTDDQREKTQEVLIPVIIVSNIVSSVMSLRRI